jgi:hypothetical protein
MYRVCSGTCYKVGERQYKATMRPSPSLAAQPAVLLLDGRQDLHERDVRADRHEVAGRPWGRRSSVRWSIG